MSSAVSYQDPRTPHPGTWAWIRAQLFLKTEHRLYLYYVLQGVGWHSLKTGSPLSFEVYEHNANLKKGLCRCDSIRIGEIIPD